MKQEFNRRAFSSIGMFLSGITLPFSGVMNHNLQLEALTSTREYWMAVHNTAGFLFAILMILHIVYNWKALHNHIKKVKYTKISKEALWAMVVFLIVVSLFPLHAII
ncbi:DUF4405 domain-containing protein [Marinifilum sp. N1E240]|uniref:DUF4405 domain-containing protein n=1 Tax=Marinifilum sp. N1E240 TaxID=2608082 RepID=UPI00128B6661|nr:DUF4405 domain-containing protein [Marinifilum sp. N1E240]MPQ47299.1 DUF4405 domain-containing protein [Marinifilum sp. N1E240]